MYKKQLATLKIFAMTLLMLFTTVNGVVFANGGDATDKTLNISAIDAFMAKEIDRLNIPGASLAIVKKNQVEYLQGYGDSSPNGTKMTPQTPIVIGSVSKSFTALAIMQLVEQEKIHLDDFVHNVLPGFQLADKEQSKKITIQHLLNQTSGLSTYDGQVAISQGDKTIKEHVQSLAYINLSSPVGKHYEYSNLNYSILGAVIEEVTNTPYKEYIDEFIFKPLEMNNSYADPKDDINNTIAHGYQTVFGIKVPTEQLIHDGTVPSGYIISSAEDMANYMMAQLNEGLFNGKSILSANAMNTLHQPSSFISHDTYYAMGWEVKNDVISHNGWTENTYSKVLLDGQYGISLQINAMDYFNLNEYDAIVSGLNKLVHHEQYTISNSNPFMKYIIFDLLFVITIMLIARSIYINFKRNKRKISAFRTVLNWFSLIIFNFLMPLFILIGFPKLFGPLSTVTIFAPGIGHLLFIIPILLLMAGVIILGKLLLKKPNVSVKTLP
ncbi:serine hydrolase domain-containing protein [Lysinibacillus sp. NPDC093210]|uniref:serine hydrolase domain-containing protein n=1 Tax=Lysinibacillus sp. NPDC093210 TaxID=3364133 RepID=UPI00381021F4